MMLAVLDFSAQSFAKFFLCSQDSTFGHATVCACFPPKVHDGTPDSAVPDLLSGVSIQQVARLMQRAT